MRDRRRRRVWLWALLVLVAVLAWRCRARPLVLGTFNIQTFPHRATDRAAVAAALAELDADAVAVQEIRDLAAFQAVLARASELSGRRYAAALVRSCRGRQKGDRLHVGVVYDAARLELVASRALSEGETCPAGQAPGLIASLRARDGQRFALASVHLDPDGTAKRFEQRKQQWAWLAAILPALKEEFGAEVVIAGDFNSTGYLDQGSAERGFIDRLTAAHRLQLPTGALACSMYWRPNPNEALWEPSLLDHVLASEDMSFGTPKALGMCAALACAPQAAEPEAMRTVSDHCPLRLELRGR